MLVNTISSIIIPILGFVKVRLFVDMYGSHINGLQLVFMQVIMYLNMFELAYSIAFRQLLYQPLANGDRNKVQEIYHGARKIFKFTGIILLFAIIIVSYFIPSFTEVDLSSGFVSLLFIMLALPFALSYFLMGPNFVIIADQKEYKIGIWIQTIAILRMFSMIIIILMKLPFIYIFAVEGLQVFIANFIARKVALKHYPWLKENPVIKNDSTFLQNAKYTVAHRLAYIANNNSDNLIINWFLGLKAVSVFGVYNYLIDAIIRIINSIITAPINSFGNLFNDKTKNPYYIFNEFYNFATFIATIISVSIFVYVNKFVYLWIGKEDYMLSQVVAALLALNVFYLTQREPIVISRDTNGLFKESRNNAYLMAFTKIVLSIILVQKYEVRGILFATLVSNWIVDFLYMPRLVFNRVFKMNPFLYYKAAFIRLFIAVSIAQVSNFIFNSFEITGIISFLIAAAITGMFTFIIVFILYFMLFKSFRELLERLRNLLLGRRKNG